MLNTMRPRIVGSVSQLLLTMNASHSSAAVVSTKENSAMLRGEYFL